MGRRDIKAELAKPSTDKLFGKLYKPETPKGTYVEVCDSCGKEFTFTNKDVKDRVIKCPHCHYDMVFFKNRYN